jgi:RNase P subunit RPR2
MNSCNCPHCGKPITLWPAEYKNIETYWDGKSYESYWTCSICGKQVRYGETHTCDGLESCDKVHIHID